MTSTPTTSPTSARASAALFVALTVRGPEIPGFAHRPALGLGPVDLALVARLAGPGVGDLEAAVAGLEAELAPADGVADAAWNLVADLRARNRLVEGPAVPTAHGVSERSVAPASTNGASVSLGIRRNGTPGGGADLLALTPTILRPVPGGFEVRAPDGTAHRLSVAEALVLAQFVRATSAAVAWDRLVDRVPSGLRDADRAAFDATVARLVAAGLAEPFDAARPGHRSVSDAEERLRRVELDRTRKLVATMQRSADERRAARTPADEAKVAVFPVQHPITVPNLALGMLLAYARAYDGGRLHQQYDLDPYWMVRSSNLKRILAERGPSIFLFSNYVWSTEHNLALSRKVKELSPESITIHGGPNTPKYEGDTAAFFAAHPHVDITVRNEGEVTTSELLDALGGRLRGRDGDLSVLAGVAGLSYRTPTGVATTADRERIADLEQIPSPFLSGVFADYEASGSTLVILETVRGCPYGCTFCDWGSSTLSRLRKFPLERVFAELEWIADHKMPRIFVADSNFGMFPRDVEIAEKVAELRQERGYPIEFHTSYAKNTTRYLKPIIETLVDAGVTSKGALALQTTDPATLEVVRRSNIKTSKYDELATAFRKEQLPLYTELMIGLPGSSVESFAADLQMVCDKEITARIYRTELLVNSPMNEPSYRQEWQIEIGGGDLNELAGMVGTGRSTLLKSTSSYTEADMDEMMRMRQVFGILENHTVLRHVARFVRQEHGTHEVDLYRWIDREATADPERWPLLAWVLDTLADCSAVPFAWPSFYDEVRRFLLEVVGVAPSSALDTVLRVQRLVMPDRGRTFPEVHDLEHDYVAWFQAMTRAKEAGIDWTDVVPPLRTYGPGDLKLEDPDDVCGLRIGAVLDNYLDVAWEVGSPISRISPPHQRTA